MALIDRNVTRSVYPTVETTRLTQTPSGDPLAFPLTTAQTLELAFLGPFNTRHFNMAVLNTTPSVVSVKVYDGNAFIAVEDVVDQTSGFTKSGFLSWINPSGWRMAKRAPIPDRELFWVEITVDTNLDAGTQIESILNLFTDDDTFRAYYPEIATDSRYLPPGRTDFIEQYLAGTSKVILRLKQDHLIEDESQILDDAVNQVTLAATHFAAWAILNPIAVSDEEKEQRDKAFDNGNMELNDVRLNIDFNKTGIIEEHEKAQADTFIVR